MNKNWVTKYLPVTSSLHVFKIYAYRSENPYFLFIIYFEITFKSPYGSSTIRVAVQYVKQIQSFEKLDCFKEVQI